MAYPPGKILTQWNPDFPEGYLDPADLGCPPRYHYTLPLADGRIQRSTVTSGQYDIPEHLSTMPGGLGDLSTYVAQYTPSVSIDLASTMAELIPEWKECRAVNQNSYLPLGRDPPRVIQPQNAVAGPTTIANDQPGATSSPLAPQVKSSPTPPVATMTPGPVEPQSQQSVTPEMGSPSQNAETPPGATMVQGPPDLSGLGVGVYGGPSAAFDPSKGNQQVPPAAAKPSDPSAGYQYGPSVILDPGEGNGDAPGGPTGGFEGSSSDAVKLSPEEDNPNAAPGTGESVSSNGLPNPNNAPPQGGQHPGEDNSNAAPGTGESVPSNGLPNSDNAPPQGSQQGGQSYGVNVNPGHVPQLPNAPAFAQYNPQPLSTQAAASLLSGVLPSDQRTPADASHPDGVAVSPGVGAIINAAFNGIASTAQPPTLDTLNGNPPSGPATAMTFPGSGQTSVSYARSFGFDQPAVPSSLYGSTPTSASGDEPVTGVMSGTPAGLPGSSVDSALSLASVTGMDSAQSATTLSGAVAMSTAGTGSQVTSNGKVIASTTARGGAGKRNCKQWWSIFTATMATLMYIGWLI